MFRIPLAKIIRLEPRPSISPCQVALLPLDAHKDENCRRVSEALEKELQANGIDVLVDDREERPGLKFKDADLIGFTLRVVVGSRSLEKGVIELRERKSGETTFVPIAEALNTIKAILAK